MESFISISDFGTMKVTDCKTGTELSDLSPSGHKYALKALLDLSDISIEQA